MATGNVYNKFSNVWPCGFRDMRVDRQTDIHAHRNTALLYRGKVTLLTTLTGSQYTGCANKQQSTRKKSIF